MDESDRNKHFFRISVWPINETPSHILEQAKDAGLLRGDETIVVDVPNCVVNPEKLLAALSLENTRKHEGAVRKIFVF